MLGSDTHLTMPLGLTSLPPRNYLYGTVADWLTSKTYKDLPPRSQARRPWYAEHEDYVAANYSTAMPVRDIALYLKRTIGAVRAKARTLGIRRPSRKQPASGGLDHVPALPVAVPQAATGVSFIVDGEELTLRRCRKGRVNWDRDAILLLIACHARMFSPKLTAEILGVPERRVTSQNHRVHLKKPDGKTYVRSLPEGISRERIFDLPVDKLIAAQNKVKFCPTMKERFGIIVPFIADKTNHYCSRAQRLLRAPDSRMAGVHAGSGRGLSVH